LKTLALSTDTMRVLQSNETRLAALAAPVGIDPNLAKAIRGAVEQAFVFGFRTMMLVCAGLSMTSAVTAWRMIGQR
jgi:hypothetical protein